MIRFIPAPPVCYDHSITSITGLDTNEIEAGILRGEYIMVNESMVVDCHWPAMVINKETSEVLASIRTSPTKTVPSVNGGRLEMYELL